VQALYLHGNELHGPMPAFHTWPTLKGLYLQDNHLTGTLPRRVAKLTNLQVQRCAAPNNPIPNPWHVQGLSTTTRVGSQELLLHSLSVA
jgi:hypothetical protein